MKKNKLVIICVIVLAIGIVLSGIGMLLGGRVYGISLGGNGLTVNSNTSIDAAREYVTEKKDLAAFKSLDMDIAFADVNVIESDHFGIDYCVQADRDIIEEMQGDKLILKQKRPGGVVQIVSIGNWTYSNMGTKSYVTVYVPAGEAFEELKISLDSGDIKLDDLLAAQLTIDDSFGTVTAGVLDVTTLDINVDSGDFTAEDIQTDKLTYDGSFGNVDIETVYAKDSEIVVDSGDISVANASGDNGTYRTSFGEISIKDMALTQKFAGVVDSGDINLGNTQAQQIDASTTFGHIEGNEVQAAIITFDADSGECNVDSISGNKIQVNTTFGGVDFGMQDSVDAYSSEIKTEFGDITINSEKAGTSYKYKQSDSENTLIINCDSGDVKLYDALN